MRAVTTTGAGEIDVLRLSDLPIPEPGPGEIRLKTVAAGVNRADLMQRRGFYPPPPGASEVIGLEVAGAVDAVGEGVTEWRRGAPAAAIVTGGGYAEFVVAPAGQCLPPPPGLDLVEAAAVVEVAATVVSNLDEAGLAAGQTLLVHGGAGGVGSFAIPYAKALGARVLTTVGSPAKADYVRGLGADVALDYHDDWPARILEVTRARGCDVILDIMGAKYVGDNIAALARRGRLIVIGLQGGRRGAVDLNAMLTKNAVVTATSLRLRPAQEKAAIMRSVEAKVWPLFASGAVRVPPLTRFPVTEVAQAHVCLESGEHIGKVVLTF